MRFLFRIGTGLAGVLVLAALAIGLPLRQQTLQRAAAQHDLLVSFHLQTLAAEIEARLSLGYALSEITTIQQVLETVQASDPGIRAIEVFDTSGLTLFSTDRALIGDQIAPGLLAGSAAGAGLGLSLRNDLGEAVGFLRLSSSEAVLPEALAQSLDRALGLVIVLLAGAALLLAGLAARGPRRAARRFLAGLEGGEAGQMHSQGAQAAQQISAAGQRLDLASQQLAGADEDIMVEGGSNGQRN